MKTSQKTLKFFADFICKELGIVYQEANYYQLEARLSEVARQAGCVNTEELWMQCQGYVKPSIKNMILEIATNNETSFFRDSGVFKAIEETILTDYFNAKPSMPFRVWSAACSFGQEPYTLSMIFDNKRDLLPFGYKITATDIADRALNAAERGQYSQLQVQRGLSPSQLAKYFRTLPSNGDNLDFEVIPELRKNISFKKLNLLSEFTALDQFHLILCRNVLIYQSLPNKRQIVNRLANQLMPGGYLILGAAESMLGVSEDFDMMRLPGAMIYKLKPRLQKTGS